MNICPKCGTPIIYDSDVFAPKNVECSECRWVGISNETIFVDDELTEVKNFESQLEELYVNLAAKVSPIVRQILIDTKLVIPPDGSDSDKDRARIVFLAKILQGATRGCIEGIAATIKQEIHYGRNKPKSGESVH